MSDYQRKLAQKKATRPVAVVCQDGYEIEYDSLRVASFSLGISMERTYAAIETGQPLPEPRRIRIRFNDGMPLEFVPDQPEPGEFKLQFPSTRVAVIHSDGRRVEYASLSAAYRATGVVHATIRNLAASGKAHKIKGLKFEIEK